MNNAKKEETIRRRQTKQKKVLIEHLQKYPIVQVACEKSDVGRQTYYRWRDGDEQFKQSADKAIADGEELYNDLSEHQLLALMRDKYWPAIRYWLDKRHPKFNKTLVKLDEPIEVSFTYNQKH